MVRWWWWFSYVFCYYCYVKLMCLGNAFYNTHPVLCCVADKSYLERVMEMPMYQPQVNQGHNTQVVTKLLNNYRSNNHILQVPDEMFYKSELNVRKEWHLFLSSSFSNSVPFAFSSVSIFFHFSSIFLLS